MLSYQHIYHAGNMADIQKHLWLLSVLDHLRSTTRSYLWIDTHAGRGLYDLDTPEAQKIGEYKNALLPLYARLQNTQPLAPVLDLYLGLISTHNKQNKTFRFYPGSALLAAQMLRPEDRLQAYDMHKGEYPHLAQALTPYKNSRTRQADGLAHLLQQIPPTEKHGGVLIDPSYEIKTEYALIAETVAKALEQWRQGIYLIWYPLLPAGHHTTLLEPLNRLNAPLTIDEWIWRAPSEKGRGLYGSGMAVLNASPETKSTMTSIKSILSQSS